MREDLLLGLRVLVSLVVVVAILWFSARRLAGSRGGGAPDLRVVGRLSLSRRSSVALVEVSGRRLLVGVGDAGVTLVSDLGAAEAALEEGRSAPAPTSAQLAAWFAAETPPTAAAGAALVNAPAAPATVPAPPAPAAPADEGAPRGGGGPLNGSILSPTVWKQTWSALTPTSPAGRHRA